MSKFWKWLANFIGAAAIVSGAALCIEAYNLKDRYSALEADNKALKADKENAERQARAAKDAEEVINAELAKLRTNDPLAGELSACRAKVDELARNQNGLVLQEASRLESLIAWDEQKLGHGLFTVDTDGAHQDAISAQRDKEISLRIAANRSDLSAMRSKLVCAR